ncbi:cytochrome P450 [Streptomyces iconiensis]|uniref:Cytochrome P450 n=1 Tax=Streptomyces iconiensis TaxID=1384038 RepID=A0ABT7A2E2_9ACTN|nr:cytochrome P450 [Streptomyces iconiensis]MDJ1134788.1 cytochrome P450 [Streptomyces iconiensis]
MTPQDVPSYPTERTCPFSPPEELATYREHEPIRRMRYPDGHIGWLVTSHSLVRQLLSDPRFSARSEFKRAPVARPGVEPFFGVPALPGWVLDLDPPEHTRIRQQLTGKFTARRMRELRPRLDRIVADLLDGMERHGGPVDLVENFTMPLSSLTICELLGVPYSEREEFQRDSKVLFGLNSTADDASAAMDRLYELLRGVAKSGGQQDGLLRTLAEDGTLDAEEITGIGAMMLSGGHGSTSSAMALGTFALLAHPDQLAKFTADPDLVDNALEELLRYVTIFHFGVPRSPLEDLEFGGQFLKAGESITVALPSANRDPEWFKEAPDQLDIERNTSGHLAFGHGIHQCTGQNLVRMEMRAALPALFQRFPRLSLAIPAAEVRIYTDTSPVFGVYELPVTW